MDRLLVRVFLQQALRQCDYALIAEADAKASTELIRVWYSLETFVVCAAKISKVFWGQRMKRDELRAIAGLRYDSPLRAMELRGAFEHFDERIVRWWNNAQVTGSYGMTDLNAGTGLEPDLRSDAWPLVQVWEPPTGRLRLGDLECNVYALGNEIRKIRPRIEAELEKDDRVQLWTQLTHRAAAQ